MVLVFVSLAISASVYVLRSPSQAKQFSALLSVSREKPWFLLFISVSILVCALVKVLVSISVSAPVSHGSRSL